MRAGRFGHAQKLPQEKKAVILFWVGPYKMAICSADVKDIRRDLGLAPAEIGCRCILSTHSMFNAPLGNDTHLIVLRQGLVGVRVDRIEKMSETGEILPLPRAFLGAEREWYFGLIHIERMIVPVVNPESLKRMAYMQEEEILDAAWSLFQVPQETLASGVSTWQDR